MKRVLFIIVVLSLVLALLLFRVFFKSKTTSKVIPTTQIANQNQNTNQSLNQNINQNQNQNQNQNINSVIANNNLAFPIDQFRARITKKPFGIYITPQNSPVQPERFTGYHTGTDIEYQDVTTDVPVYAIADGKIVLSETASGYGGVFVLDFKFPDGSEHTAIYGHIRPSSLPKSGARVTKNQQLAVLGTGYSAETDGERRHLHFGIRADHSINILGYVQTKAALSGWIDPVSLYQ